MAEATAGKKETVVETVTMKDGRQVQFAGTRKMNKSFTVNGDGSVDFTIDFRNGETVKTHIPADLKVAGEETLMLQQLAGHGGVQKLGDEAANSKGQMTIEDQFEAVSNLSHRLENGEWYAPTEGGSGFSGAGVVVRALMEHTGKSQDQIRDFIEKRLEALKADAEAKNEKPTSRAALYASFRKHPTIGAIIQRLEDEKASKAAPTVNVDEELAALKAAA